MSGAENISDLVDRLSSNLSHHDQANVAGLIANLCDDDDTRREIRELGGISLLLGLLEEENQTVQKRALGALTNLTIDDESVIEIVNVEGIPKLIEMLNQESSVLRAYSAGVLLNMSNNSKSREAIRSCDGVKIMAQRLLDGDIETRCNVTGAVGAVCLDAESCKTLRDYNAVGAVVKNLDETDEEMLQKASGAVWNLATNPANHEQMKESGVLKLLLKQVNNEDQEVAVNCCVALGTLGSYPENAQAIIEMKAIQPIVDVMKRLNDANVIHPIVGVLWNLGRNELARKEIREAGGLDPLVMYLDSRNKELLERTLGSIVSIGMDDKNAQIIGEQNAIPKIVRFLSLRGHENHDYFTIQRNAVVATAVLAYNDNNRDKIRESDGIDPIIEMIKTANETFQERGSAAIMNLALNAENRSEVRMLDGIAPLIDLLYSPNENVQQNAAGALWNLSIDPQNKMVIRELGGLKPLLALIAGGNNNLRPQDRSSSPSSTVADPSESKDETGRDLSASSSVGEPEGDAPASSSSSPSSEAEESSPGSLEDQLQSAKGRLRNTGEKRGPKEEVPREPSFLEQLAAGRDRLRQKHLDDRMAREKERQGKTVDGRKKKNLSDLERSDKWEDTPDDVDNADRSFDAGGYDQDGFDRDGFDRDGLDRNEYARSGGSSEPYRNNAVDGPYGIADGARKNGIVTSAAGRRDPHKKGRRHRRRRLNASDPDPREDEMRAAYEREQPSFSSSSSAPANDPKKALANVQNKMGKYRKAGMATGASLPSKGQDGSGDESLDHEDQADRDHLSRRTRKPKNATTVMDPESDEFTVGGYGQRDDGTKVEAPKASDAKDKSKKSGVGFVKDPRWKGRGTYRSPAQEDRERLGLQKGAYTRYGGGARGQFLYKGPAENAPGGIVKGEAPCDRSAIDGGRNKGTSTKGAGDSDDSSGDIEATIAKLRKGNTTDDEDLKMFDSLRGRSPYIQAKISELEQSARSGGTAQYGNVVGEQANETIEYKPGMQLTYAQLSNQPGKPAVQINGIDPSQKESYLSDDEFKRVFKMDKTKFKKQPKWKQTHLKKKVGLF